MSLNVVIVGAVALGPKAACRIKRLRPDAEITMIDQDSFFSYGGCGMPYYLSEDVPDETALRSTSFHAVRDEKFFLEAKGVTVLPRTRAVRIDRTGKVVHGVNLDTGAPLEFPYDKLVIGTGSRPVVPPVPGRTLKNVFTVSNLQDALDIKQAFIKEEIHQAVVVGGGAIGVEITEALADMWGFRTALVERLEHVLPGLFDSNFAAMAETQMKEHGVDVFTGESVVSLEGDDEGKVREVVTSRRRIKADLVVLAAGVKPNSQLAAEAGLEITSGGGIQVDEFLRTSDENVYAGGDCVENRNLVSGEKSYAPLGSLANRHGRVIGSNVAGGQERFEGIAGSFIVKIFSLCLASAGFSQAAARRAGMDAERVLTVGYDRSHFWPEKGLLFLQLVVDRSDRRVLGIQGAGKANDAVSVRINAVAALLGRKPTVEDISNLEIAYSPPFSSAMDAVNALGNTAANLLDGLYRRMTVEEALELLGRGREGGGLFLDLNDPRAAAPYVERYPGLWVNIPYQNLRSRISELPREARIVTICDSGIRSYESQVMLAAEGYRSVFAMEGGLNALRKMGIDLLSE